MRQLILTLNSLHSATTSKRRRRLRAITIRSFETVSTVKQLLAKAAKHTAVAVVRSYLSGTRANRRLTQIVTTKMHALALQYVSHLSYGARLQLCSQTNEECANDTEQRYLCVA